MTLPPSIELALQLLQDPASVEVRLFMVSRRHREGIKSRTRAADKYNYRPLRATMDEEAKTLALEGIRSHIVKSVSTDDFELRDYQLIDSDDATAVYTYPSGDLARLAFAQAIGPIRGDTATIEELDWENAPDLHGYALSVQGEGGDVILFNRLGSRRVHQPHSVNFRWFGISGGDLVPLDGPVLTFDYRVSCLIVNGELIILSKKQFEDLVGFNEELEENANKVIDALEHGGLIEGADVLRGEIKKSGQYLRKMASLTKNGHVESMSPDRIAQMRISAEEHGLHLPLDGKGRLVIRDRKDIQNIIKWIADSFVTSIQSKRLYEASVKSPVASIPSDSVRRSST